MKKIHSTVATPVAFFFICVVISLGTVRSSAADEGDSRYFISKDSTGSRYSIREIHSDRTGIGSNGGTGNISCPCGTCWEVETHSFSTGNKACDTCKTLSHLRMCTPAGWKQTGNDWCSARNRHCQ